MNTAVMTKFNCLVADAPKPLPFLQQVRVALELSAVLSLVVQRHFFLYSFKQRTIFFLSLPFGPWLPTNCADCLDGKRRGTDHEKVRAI